MSTFVQSHALPILYGYSSDKKIKHWKIKATCEDGAALLHTAHGFMNGAVQETSKEIKGKNIGKANETSPFSQACKEAKSAWKKKLDSNYRESIEELEDLPLLPMLAHPYEKRKHDIRWPCFVQPKLNGVRCLATKKSNDVIIYISRTGKVWETLDYMTPYLLPLMEIGETLDGEIFNPDLTFQEITKRVKRVKTSRFNISHDPLEYHIFDIVNEHRTFEDRFGSFVLRYTVYCKDSMVATDKVNPIVIVPTVEVGDEDQMLKLHKNWTRDGYEGTILRNHKGMYVTDNRSKNLQKHKDFMDEEFKVVGGHEGIGHDKGTVIFTCVTKDGQNFNVRPKGTRADRANWWNNLDRFVGSLLTVKFQNYSDDGIPIFPVGLGLRNYE